jgi:sec-independent protein translocase protein TatB
MDIFGIGWLELVFILIIAMIVVGPRDLGKVGRQIGRFLNRMYKSDGWRMLNETSRTIRTLPNRLAREAALEELDAVRDSIKDAGKMIRGDLRALNEPLDAWTPPGPHKEEPKEVPPANPQEPSAPAEEDNA